VEQQGRVVAEQQQTNLAALSVKINKLASQQQEQQQQQQQQVEVSSRNNNNNNNSKLRHYG